MLDHRKIRRSSRSTLKLMRRLFNRTTAVIAIMCVGVISVTALSFVTKWGGTGSANGQFLTPTAIAVDAAGNVYVAEGSGNRVQKFDGNGGFILKFGSPGSSGGEFVTPTGIAVDSAGNIYVSDAQDPINQVSKFNSSGTFLTFVGSGFLNPSGVATDSANNVYILDSNNHRVRKYDSAGSHLLDFGSSGSGNGELGFPQGIAIDASNNVYIADTSNNRVEEFTSAGGFVRVWGGLGSGNGQFTSPDGVTAAGGNVYVADTGNNRIQKFDSVGNFVEAFGSSGSGDGEFAGPQDLAADVFGNVFVADTNNDRVQKLSNTASPLAANAGPDQTVECSGATTSVSLDGTGSTGTGTLTYTWTEGTTTLGNGATLGVALPAGTHTITLTVSSSGGGSDTDDVIINIVDTQGPTITLNGSNPMTVECHTAFVDPGAMASDACAGDLTSAITETGSVNSNAVGSYTLTYMVSDGSHSASVSRTVNVVDTTAPVIALNGANPITVECHTSFTDPGAIANDSCGGSFAATPSGTVNVNAPGTYTIIYNATDPSGNPAAPVSRTVNVVDTTAPVINLNGAAPVLWSPNHQYVTFTVADFMTSVTDSCNTSLGLSSVVISQVTSDEVEDGAGDGSTLNDIVIAGNCRSVQLRSERNGSADGRVYTIYFRVTDASGNVGTASAKVTVPQSQGSGPAVDSGPHYTVNGSCP
jgi:hypothetical protein